MRKMMIVCAMLGSFSALGLAVKSGDTWSGTLVDRSCYLRSKSVGGCVARRGSSSYLLKDPKGNMYELDGATNRTASQAIASLNKRSRANDMRSSGPVFAGIVGHMNSRGHISADRLSVER
jgi:hypothetical protein